MEMDKKYNKEITKLHNKTSPNLEPGRGEEKRKAKEHMNNKLERTVRNRIGQGWMLSADGQPIFVHED